MTATATLSATEPETSTNAAAPTSDWTQQFAALQTRYPKVREPILAALLVLTQDPNADLDAAKATAAEHSVRITAASVAAARRLLSRQDGPPAPAAPRAKSAATPRRGQPARRIQPSLDVEELLRATVAKIQAQRDAEAERLREAMREAIAVLDAAVG